MVAAEISHRGRAGPVTVAGQTIVTSPIRRRALQASQDSAAWTVGGRGGAGGYDARFTSRGRAQPAPARRRPRPHRLGQGPHLTRF